MPEPVKTNPNQKPNQKPNPNQKPKDTTQRVNVMSSGFASGVVTKGQPMSLADQKAKKAGGIF